MEQRAEPQRRAAPRRIVAGRSLLSLSPAGVRIRLLITPGSCPYGDEPFPCAALSSGEQAVVLTHMTLRYGVSFAARFRDTAAARHRPEISIEITNDPRFRPERLTAEGFRLQGTDDRIEYWVHPSGRSVWRLPSSVGRENPSLTSGAMVDHARQLVDDLTDVNSRTMSQRVVNAGITQLIEVRTDSPDQYPDIYRDFRADLTEWDQQYAAVQQQVAALRARVRPEYSTALDTEITRLAALQRWRRNIDALLARDLPEPR